MTHAGTRLFVIVDPLAEHQVALVKALLIAKLGDCHVHAFLCTYRDMKESGEYASRHDFKHQTLIEAEQWLKQQLQAFELAGVPYTSEIVWNSNWCDSALHAIAKSDCDLVIKSSFHHSRARRFFGKTSDYSLMRNCAKPILFTHLDQDWKSNRLLACVDLEARDPRHARLDEVIVRDAQALAKIVGMDLYIGSAYSVEIDAANLPVKGQGHEVNAENIAELYGLEADRVYLRKGATLDTLEEICNEVDPSIVIMGTLARGGVSGMLIGNTAEKLLDIIDADILTVN